MVNKVTTATVIGLNAYKVDVEIDVTNSLPGISIVGLPDAAVNEARDRVRSASKNSNLTFPDRKIRKVGDALSTFSHQFERFSIAGLQFCLYFQIGFKAGLHGAKNMSEIF